MKAAGVACGINNYSISNGNVQVYRFDFGALTPPDIKKITEFEEVCKEYTNKKKLEEIVKQTKTSGAKEFDINKQIEKIVNEHPYDKNM